MSGISWLTVDLALTLSSRWMSPAEAPRSQNGVVDSGGGEGYRSGSVGDSSGERQNMSADADAGWGWDGRGLRGSRR